MVIPGRGVGEGTSYKDPYGEAPPERGNLFPASGAENDPINARGVYIILGAQAGAINR